MKLFFVNLCLFLIISTTSFAQRHTPSDSIYVVQDSISIPTKSGVAISATLVYKIANLDPLPVVLFYTTYYQGEGDVMVAKRSADRDYIGIVAYARGIRSDIQNYFPYENEQDDIYDIIEWISKQPWCDGKVGMFGGSYTGFSQWSSLKNKHPALKTIVPQVAVMPGFDFPMQNNVQVGFELNWLHDNIFGKGQLPPSLMWEWFEKGYAYSQMDSAVGYSNQYFQKWLQHPAYDAYWKSLAPTSEDYAKIDIPILTTTGYFDGPQISAVEYFNLHIQSNPNAEHYLVIGPYDHRGGQANSSPNLRGYAIDSVAKISMRTLAYDFLDWILKDAQKPELLQDKVNLQVMGTNTWRHAPTLKALSNQSLRLYLDQGMLVKEKPLKQLVESLVVDFSDREQMHNYFHPSLIIDSLDASNGLVFKTDFFIEEFIINGAFGGELVVETNKKDMDMSISFYEQTLDSTYFLLSRYVGRASYAKDRSNRQLLTPNKREQIPLQASHIISKKIKKGSRFVIVANVNKHPFEIINYGSGKLPTEETISDAGEPMRIKWFNDSYIEIGVWRD